MQQIEVGAVLEGKVTGIMPFGAFVELPGGKTGLVHISEVAYSYVKEISEFLKVDQTVKVKVLGIEDNGKISLSIKKAEEPKKKPYQPQRANTWTPAPKKEPASFEDMMAKFKQTSEERMSDLKKSVESKRGGFSKKGGGHSK